MSPLESPNHVHAANVQECQFANRLNNLRRMAEWEKHYMLAFLSGESPEAFDSAFEEMKRLRKTLAEAQLLAGGNAEG